MGKLKGDNKAGQRMVCNKCKSEMAIRKTNAHGQTVFFCNRCKREYTHTKIG